MEKMKRVLQTLQDIEDVLDYYDIEYSNIQKQESLVEITLEPIKWYRFSKKNNLEECQWEIQARIMLGVQVLYELP